MFIAKLSGKVASALTGTIVHATVNTECGDPTNPVIMVIPNGNPDYYPAVALAARRQGTLGLILETGGPLCHLAVVGNESTNIAVMLLPNARKILEEGDKYTLKPNSCAIELELSAPRFYCVWCDKRSDDPDIHKGCCAPDGDGHLFNRKQLSGPPAVICPYCGKHAKLVTGAEIYPEQPQYHKGNYWLCSDCYAYVGTHKTGDNTKPLGTLADAELRTTRAATHKLFDPLWENGTMSRSEAYRWLAEQMGIPASECHIGMFTRNDCAHVKAVVGKWYSDNKKWFNPLGL